MAQRNGDRYYLSELYRIKGELLLVQAAERGDPLTATGEKDVVEVERAAVVQAEACFSESIKIAVQQKARSWELRSAISLARLYKNHGKQKKARCLLTQIYDRFTEGFETADLKAARQFIDTVGRPA